MSDEKLMIEIMVFPGRSWDEEKMKSEPEKHACEE